MKKVQVIWDHNDGTFVLHFEGYAKHADEHDEIDSIKAGLEKRGYKVRLSHGPSGQHAHDQDDAAGQSDRRKETK